MRRGAHAGEVMRRSLLLLLLAIAPVALADEGILAARVIRAYGGETAIRKVAALRETGWITTTMRRTNGPVTRTWSLPDKLRVEIAYPDAPELRIVNGDRGSRDGELVGGPQLDAMVLQAGRMFFPALLLEKKAVIREGLPVERDGVKLVTLLVPLAGSMSFTLEIDPRTHYIVRSYGTVPVDGGGSIEFATIYSDFRKVQGVVIPFAEENFARGQKTGDTVLEHVEVNPNLPDGTFDVGAPAPRPNRS